MSRTFFVEGVVFKGVAVLFSGSGPFLGSFGPAVLAAVVVLVVGATYL